MANTFTNVKDAAAIIARAAGEMFEDQMHFGKSIAKADPEDFKGKNGYSAGDTIKINLPARFTPQSTFDITSSIQNITEETKSLPLDIIKTIGVDIDSFQFATEIQMQSTIDRVVKPAVSSIAQFFEQELLAKATDATFNSVGTPGQNVFDPDAILSARERMNKFLCPKDDERYFLADSTAMRKAVNARKSLQNAAPEVSKQYKQGYVGQADGFMWMESELLNTHTLGNDVTGVTVDGAAQSGATLALQGFTAATGTITKGSVFTIDGVFAVHPITKVKQNFLQQFTVLADDTADASGDIVVSISPAIVAAGSNQNVSNVPGDTEEIVFVGSAAKGYLQNLAYHKEAFRMVTVPLVMPTSAEVSAQYTTKGGTTVQLIRDFDILKRRMITRLDILGGIVAVRPEWACRITS